VESGGLIAYSDDFAEELRQAAGYIDRILRGARVGELPIQQPTKFELVINMKTAKALGLTLSSGLLSIADEVMNRPLFAAPHMSPPGTEETMCDFRCSVVIGAEADMALTSADDGA
jgi:hypothetical protein